MNKVAIGRVVLTNREHIIALEPLDNGLMGTLLRYPYEVRSEKEYFGRYPGRSKSPRTCWISQSTSSNRSPAPFEPEKFDDRYEAALIDLINQKRDGYPRQAKPRRNQRQRQSI